MLFDSNSRSRRDVLKTIGAGSIAVAGAVGSTGTAAADESATHYHNPTYSDRVFPDPTVIRTGDGTYYAYASNMEKDSESQEEMVPILRSSDLVDWTYVGEAFESYPDWRSDDASLWAPDINYYDGQYYLYYSYSVWGSDNDPGIGLATADSPEGPFTDQGPVFRESDLGMTNAIDSEFRVVDGTPYIVWGSWYGLYGVELTADGTDYVPGTTFHLAGDHREAPFLLERDGYYYLFYSTGYCCEGYDSTYSVEVGRSTSFTGPYYNQNGTDLRDLNEHNSGVAVLSGNDRFTAPGHNGAIQDDNGDWWMLYHAYDDQEPEFVDGTWNRILMTDRIQWEDGWPVVAGDGTPSYQSRVPHTADTGPVSDGVYRIENAATGKALEVYESSTADGANVVQWAWHGGENQQWWVEFLGSDQYRLVNENSDRAADVPDGSTAAGTSIHQWGWWAGPMQKWLLNGNGDGTYTIENVNSGLALDVQGSSASDGADVIQETPNGSASQRWTLEPL
ncbi:family 43 glycosylhydrolase [Natrinema sp. DC36]|uniref:family 43 glycosylhydrolase n=1 Tax=Natrinema sp. DC36 TaxID=2878680 RepID=UPI001CF0A4E1|nr:family 43 glycosylhydrolase [Natrinema sp. DC36]